VISITELKSGPLSRFLLLSLLGALLSACIEPSSSDTGNPQASAVGGPITNPTLSLSADSQSIGFNASTTLNWSANNATECTASGAWSGNKNTSGSEQVGPLTQDTSYTLTCTGSGMSVDQTIVINVANPPAPSLTFSANTNSVAYGGTVSLSWSSQNVNACAASGAWSDTRNTSGSSTSSTLTADSTFTLTCTGAGGDVTRSVLVSVGAPPPSTPTVTLSASPDSIAYSGSTTISWSSTNASSCSASGAWSGSKALSGSQNFSNLTSSGTFTLSCSGAGGSTNRSVTVNVANPPSPTLSFTGNPTTVDYNDNATLNWSTTNATSCSASGAWSGGKGTTGSESVGPLTANSSYTLSCSGPGGNINRTVLISVNPAPQPTVTLDSSPASVAAGGQTTLSWSSTSASSCTASGAWSGSKAISGSESVGPINSNSTFTLNCTGPGGSRSDSTTVTIAPTPTVTIGANPQTVSSGEYSTLTWSSSNASSCSASGDWPGSKSTSGSETVGPLSSDSQFSLTCTGTGGDTTNSTTVTITQSTRSVNVSWTAPTTRSDGSPLNDLDGFRIYYGTTSGNYTQTVTVNDENATSYVISGLTPGTYYFAVTAFDSANNESTHSTEASVNIN